MNSASMIHEPIPHSACLCLSASLVNPEKYMSKASSGIKGQHFRIRSPGSILCLTSRLQAAHWASFLYVVFSSSLLKRLDKFNGNMSHHPSLAASCALPGTLPNTSLWDLCNAHLSFKISFPCSVPQTRKNIEIRINIHPNVILKKLEHSSSCIL